MWMRFPNGAVAISVERQNFSVEATDEEGRGYFRVPAHFAPQVVALGLGYEIVDPPKGTNLIDLPLANPVGDGALALEARLADAQTDLATANAQVSALRFERDQLKLQIHELMEKVTALEVENDELREASEISASASSGKKK